MQAVGLLLFSILVSFASLAQLANNQLTTKTIYNNHILALMAGELTVKHLQQVYNTALRADKTAKDKLLANIGGDKLEVYQNKYHSFLLNAEFTSRRLAFGHGIRVGATKLAFCKAFGLSTNYNLYKVIENPEGGYEMTFKFENETLTEVMYRVNYTD